jgi:hypothetical protein
MFDKTEPWLMGVAEGVTEGITLELRLRDMLGVDATEELLGVEATEELMGVEATEELMLDEATEETRVVPVGVTGVEGPTVGAGQPGTVVCDGGTDVTTVGSAGQTPGGEIQIIKPK